VAVVRKKWIRQIQTAICSYCDLLQAVFMMETAVLPPSNVVKRVGGEFPERPELLSFFRYEKNRVLWEQLSDRRMRLGETLNRLYFDC
jgi:hypothetical protein